MARRCEDCGGVAGEHFSGKDCEADLRMDRQATPMPPKKKATPAPRPDPLHGYDTREEQEMDRQ